MEQNEGLGPATPYEVGYGRPPVGTRFKKGDKPPPRKKKKTEDVSPRELLWRLLQEERRVVIDGKAQRMRTSEIILNKAFFLADKGNATLQRLVMEIMMMGSVEDQPNTSAPRLISNPDSTEPSGTGYLRHRMGG